MPEIQTASDTLMKILEKKYVEIDRLNAELKSTKQDVEIAREAIRELEDRLADCAQQHKDPTMPETPTKLEAYWKGFSDCNSKNATSLNQKDEFISKLTRERDALRQKIGELEKLIPQYQPIRPMEGSATEFQILRSEHAAFSKRMRELAAEKAHYEKVAQECTNRIQTQDSLIKSQANLIEEFKSNNRYHKGHSAGYAEAVENMKTFLQTRK